MNKAINEDFDYRKELKSLFDVPVGAIWDCIDKQDNNQHFWGIYHKDTILDPDYEFSDEIKEQVKNIAEAERLAKKKLREKNCQEWTGNFTVVGNLNLVAAITIKLLGFGKYDGKYIITRASHSIGSGYQTSIEVRRCLNGY